MNMPPMNFDAAQMNSMGPDEYQMNQALQQQQTSGAARSAISAIRSSYMRDLSDVFQGVEKDLSCRHNTLHVPIQLFDFFFQVSDADAQV